MLLIKRSRIMENGPMQWLLWSTPQAISDYQYEGRDEINLHTTRELNRSNKSCHMGVNEVRKSYYTFSRCIVHDQLISLIIRSYCDMEMPSVTRVTGTHHSYWNNVKCQDSPCLSITHPSTVILHFQDIVPTRVFQFFFWAHGSKLNSNDTDEHVRCNHMLTVSI